MLSLYEILKASKTGIAPDMWTALTGKNWGGKDSGAEVKELTGIPPLSFKADGTPLLDYLISGNMEQSGTPTLTNPIQPQETGERTGNLANTYGISAEGLNLTFTTGDGMTVVINGTKTDGANIRDLVHPNIILPAGTYTVKIKMISGSITNITGGVMFGINKSNYSLRTAPQVNTVGQVGTRTFTLNSDTLLTSLDITPSYGDVGAVFNNATFQCWLYSGNSDVPYEPYGYKIPISSGGTTTNNYLGEVETTRRIKKLVLTGNEIWDRVDNCFRLSLPNSSNTVGTIISTHFEYKIPWALINTASVGACVSTTYYGTAYKFLMIRCDDIATKADDFKSYLAAQYAAGTPVTVWYVLATPETGIVNEPLRKIGDYADTVSMEQAGVSVPTNRGNTVIDVETELKPSEMYIKYQE